ncbi:GNAT family N-acetyltransferase [Streptomyces sclerotialus]|uniref:GNAT family N-acetyltransferase n=1 Tax=Streptomyces sclerotialus TaxID=1957 RepID=UPI0004C534A6
MLSLTEIAEDPVILTRRLKPPGGRVLVFRPLTCADAERLAAFLTALSPETRRLSTFDGYDLAAARELCDAIARYDKLRLVLEEVPALKGAYAPAGRIVGLLEFSLALTAADIARYRKAGIRLTERTDCRFGPTLADDYQDRGVGTLLLPLITEVAQLLGRTRIILWGGVLTHNPRAIRYYEKNGFQPVGCFSGADGSPSLDMILDLRSSP